MPATPHFEKHFTASESVRDVVIGMADGLTVPFALAAGLSAAVANTDVIVTAGLAEVVAGAIAMGLGGYLAARTDAEHYAAEEQRAHHEIDQLREREVEEVEQIFREYGLEGDALKSVVGAVASNRQRWVDFMMRFELVRHRYADRSFIQQTARHAPNIHSSSRLWPEKLSLKKSVAAGERDRPDVARRRLQ